MRVLVCSTARFGIANTVYNVIDKLDDSNIKITYCRNPLNPSPECCETVDLLSKRQFTYLLSIVDGTPLSRATNFAYGIITYWIRAFKYIESHGSEFEVVWLHNPHPMIMALNFPPINNILITVHSIPKEGLRTGLEGRYQSSREKLRKQQLKRSEVKAVTGVGPSVTEAIVGSGVNHEKIEMIPNGVNVSRFSPSNQSEFNGSWDFPMNNVILSVGRFTESKRPSKIIEMFSVVERERSDTMLVMAGSGERLQSVKDKVDSIGVEHIEFLGYVPREETPGLYASADYYVLASEYEAGYPPLSLAEAMASGLPCIVPDIQCGEFINAADCGIVVDFDSDDVGEQVVKYLNMSPDNHGEKARAYAENNFGWNSISNRYRDVLEGVVNM